VSSITPPEGGSAHVRSPEQQTAQVLLGPAAPPYPLHLVRHALGDGAAVDQFLEGEGQDRPFRLFLLPTEPKEKAEGKGEPPNFWGRATLAAGSQPIQISVWEQDSRFQINPDTTKYLRGNTQYPLDRAKQGAAPDAGRDER
jgi:hypothetical protein